MIIKNHQSQVISIEKFASSCQKTYVFISWERIMPYFIEYVEGLEMFSFFITFKMEEYDGLISFTNFYKECTFVYPINIHFPQLQQCALKPNCILFNCEQMTIPERRQMIEQFLERGGRLFDYNIENCRILWKNFQREQVLFLPYRCTDKEKNYLLNLLKMETKEFDAAVVASWTPRRIEIVQSLQDAGIKICMIKDTFGVERDRLIAKSKCLLNIHANDNYNIFETIRCLRWLDAGFTVVTEPCIGVDMPNDRPHKCLKIVETKDLASFLKTLKYNLTPLTVIGYDEEPLEKVNKWFRVDNTMAPTAQISFCYGANDRFMPVKENLPLLLHKNDLLNNKYGDPILNVKKDLVLIYGEAVVKFPEERKQDYVITAEKNGVLITAQ